MINLDSSIIPAIVISLLLIAVLNQLPFKPLARLLAEKDWVSNGMLGHFFMLENKRNACFKYQISVGSP